MVITLVFQTGDVGSIPVICTKTKNKKMSIFATNFTIDENTGEVKLIKRLNKIRIDRGGWNSTPGGWNKSGRKARLRKTSNILNKKSRVKSVNIIEDDMN